MFFFKPAASGVPTTQQGKVTYLRGHRQFKLDLTDFCCFVLFAFKEDLDGWGSGRGGYICELRGVKMIKHIVQDP